ncbi:replicative DNA helicase [Nannocystis bainbridge]|uniref:DNA 5'-3' helicase n=1 Tax=Nannocystis bainbridge TaxID=2995303 RepID=A0ABT5E275_9BACT|nr:replicative DNA helicase [Nannocystis bainbridge]MDC0719948.1 replicative DNA helicase [Nannocystis bainbridge]
MPTERAVVGAVLVFGAAALDAVATLRPAEDFTARGLAEIVMTARELAARGVQVDPVTVDAELRQRHPKLVDLVYLSGLADASAPRATLPRHAAELRRLGTLRELRFAALDLAERCGAPDADPAELRIRAARVAETRRDGTGLRTARDAIADLFRAWKEGPPPRLSWGIPQIDEMVGGMRPGNVYVLGGRPGHGKTSLALQVARALAVPRNIQRELGDDPVRPVLLIELEMPEAEVVEALLAQESGIDAKKVAARILDDESSDAIFDAAERIAAGRLSIDCESFTITQIEERAREWRRLNPDGMGLIVLDYVQLVKATETPGGYERRDLEVAEISRALKRLSKDLAIPILVIAALNRASEARQGHRPGLADLRECGRLEYDASAALFVFREELYLIDGSSQNRQRLAEVAGTAEILVAKNRHGATGVIRLAYVKALRRFAVLQRRL